MEAGIAFLAATTKRAVGGAQGGFFPVPVMIAGIVSLIVALMRVIRFRMATPRELHGVRGLKKTAEARPWEEGPRGICVVVLPLAFALIAFLEAASVWVHGLGADRLSYAACWASLAAFAWLCAGMPNEQKARAIDGLGWFVVVMAAVGALAAVGVLPSAGTMAAGRLCILFEYSNATGIWFAMGSIVLMASEDDRLRALAIVPFFALLATKSVGAIVVTALALAVTAALFLRRREEVRAGGLAASWLGALVSFAAYLWVPVAGVVVVGLGAVLMVREALRVRGALCRSSREEKRRSKRASRGCSRRDGSAGGWKSRYWAARVLILAAVGATLVCVVVVLAAEPARWAQAQETFAERLVQMGDGLTLLMAQPWSGIGPGQWAELYPMVQTSDYIAAVNHCSYMQMALDGGIIVPVVYVAALVTSVVLCMKQGHPLWALAVVTLLVHSVFDFDLSFFALQFFAVLLVSSCREWPLSGATGEGIDAK